LQTFAYLGIAYLVITMATGYFMQNPPDGWKPAGWAPSTTQTKQRAAMDYTLGGALKTWQWWALWALLFLNTSAGISIISQESPMFQEIAKVSAVVAAGNGRHCQHWQRRRPNLLGLDLRRNHQAMDLRDDVPASGRPFLDTASISSAAILAVLAFIVLMCYGGGFGTMPAFAADYFGSKNVGPIYGLMLTAWGCASAFGPLLIAHMRQSSGSYTSGLHVIAGIMAFFACA
jgi:MFS transporter, OFA family, oxalate/formate antiporter